MADTASMPELHGWDLVAAHVTEAEPPPIPEGEWTVDGSSPTGWVNIECNRLVAPIRIKTLGSAYGLHPKRNLEVARMWAAPPELIAFTSAALGELESELIQRKTSGNDEEFAALQTLCEHGHAALAKARGEQ